eukprot:TRINITY_DN1393_c0_g4_i1.p1 TRINITY_DN1393_c0_g4~~TRINITY_DN1393_c0_g4_i1.p1  ORF type:complete len:418 (+),score=111.61 TRINITY_DN1393_c0_g4_i1:139-1254(+)
MAAQFRSCLYAVTYPAVGFAGAVKGTGRTSALHARQGRGLLGRLHASPFISGCSPRSSSALHHTCVPACIWRAIKFSVMAQAAGEDSASVATEKSHDELLELLQRDNKRFLHVVYRVGDLHKTIRFYTECLGMKLLRKRDIPEEKYTNAFLGYGPESSHFVVELTYNYGVDNYDIGTGFGHFGIAVEDVYKLVELIKAKGGKVIREAGPVKGGKSVIAFVEDPDGYKFELIQRPATPEPLCQVMLRVGDLDRSIQYYEKALGMKLLRTRDNPEYKYTLAMMGYGEEERSAVLELTYNYGVTKYSRGTAYGQIAIGTNDVYVSAEAIRKNGGKITREPGPLPGIKTKIVAALDPDGWKTVLVDNEDFLRELE